ncbi:EmrB/QacA family drug resistance transporter [Burkholderia diffusa]|uniref:EmrB/QacA family drug resistance transporter n=2 Tax=Burkholderiaceae TaxID=119060 RepID=A0A6P2PUY4_9BURK|nr:DHA2 family efflux MFS transporter permease subunit [Burkholderia diffusa]RQZ59039.1 MFS transporter [Burkholderia sp. Bp9004]VWC10822.1 EmrB/QacA family drug resistance transporter [Burkholderia diffusa]
MGGTLPPQQRNRSTSSAHERRMTITLWLVAAGFFMQTLDTTIVNTALPGMARSLGEAPLHMQSVVIAYSLTMALMIPISGCLADRFGTRRVFFSAIVIFTLGSLLCANAQTLWQLVLFRVVQGAGGAMLLPIGRLAVIRSFSRERYLPALTFIAIPGLVGPLVGPMLGGWLTEAASWHWIFLINVPIGVLGCAATAIYMPGEPLPTAGRFDVPGYLMLAVSMLSITLALDGVAEFGLTHRAVIGLVALTFAGIGMYCFHARRIPDPLFPLKLFDIRTFRIGLSGNVLARIGAGAMPYLLPLLLQVSLGYAPFHAGMMMLPIAAAGMACRPPAVRLITSYGYRKVLLINTLAMGLSMSCFALISPSQPAWLHVAQFAMFGAVNATQFTAMNAVTLRDLGTVGASSGNSLFSLAQMLSMSLGVTIAGALLDQFTEMFGHQTHFQTLTAFHATFACIGLVTASAALIFARLTPEARVVSVHAGAAEEA